MEKLYRTICGARPSITVDEGERQTTLYDCAAECVEMFGHGRTSGQIEILLRRGNTPIAWLPDNSVGYFMTLLTEQEAKRLEMAFAHLGSKTLLSVQVQWPQETVTEGPDGPETVISYPEEPTWQERVEIDGVPVMRDVHDEEGNVTGQEEVFVTKRVPRI